MKTEMTFWCQDCEWTAEYETNHPRLTELRVWMMHGLPNGHQTRYAMVVDDSQSESSTRIKSHEIQEVDDD